MMSALSSVQGCSLGDMQVYVVYPLGKVKDLCIAT